jgi:chemotaxis protein CheX
MLLRGVGAGAIPAQSLNGAMAEMEAGKTYSLRDSMHLVSEPMNLDASVDEVFRMMLGERPERVGADGMDTGGREPESVTAVVGFGGVLSGACVFRSSVSLAVRIAAQMTGMEIHEMDYTVKDAIGEICNMLAGAWKGKVPGLSANCGLSVPAVISGRDYSLHVQSPEFQLAHSYRYHGGSFVVTIVCDNLL